MRYQFRGRVIAFFLLGLIACWQLAGMMHTISHHDCTEKVYTDVDDVTFSAPECELCDFIDHQVYYLISTDQLQLARAGVLVDHPLAFAFHQNQPVHHYLRGPPQSA